jgi:hypothetical protein
MKKAFLLSLLVHLLIIASFFLTLKNIITSASLSPHKMQSIAAYFYEEHFVIKKEKTKPITLSQALPTTAVIVPMQHKAASKQMQKIIMLATANTSYDEKETAPPQLAVLLHDIIQNAVNAKVNFSLPGKQKQVRITFILFPDGHLEDVKILEQDSLAVFNELVLDTIKNLPHISAAQSFLKQSQRFTVMIKT